MEKNITISLKTAILLVIIVLALIAGSAVAVYYFAVIHEVDNVVADLEVEDETELPEEIIEDERTFSWIVEPTLEFDQVWFDWDCDEITVIVDGVGAFVNTDTGEPTDRYCPGHGGGVIPFVMYNSELSMFGVMNGGTVEFTKESLEDVYEVIGRDFVGVTSVFAVRYATTPETTISYFEMFYEDYEIEFGRIAFATRDGLITEFIFDNIDSNVTAGYPAVAQGDITVVNGQRWGFIDNEGNQIIDFIFEAAVSIDDETAFVKVDGLWGIIRKT